MSKILKKVIEKRYIIFAKKKRKKDTETVIHFANCNLRSTYFDQIYINMSFIGKTWQKLKKNCKEGTRFAKKKCQNWKCQ